MSFEKEVKAPIEVKVGDLIQVYGAIFRCVEAKKQVGRSAEVRFESIEKELTRRSELARYCGNQNPSPAYPYKCTKPFEHVDAEDPKEKRHGYAGVFWT